MIDGKLIELRKEYSRIMNKSKQQAKRANVYGVERK